MTLFARRGAAYLTDLFLVFALMLTMLVACVATYGTVKYGGDPELMKALLRAPSTRDFTFWAHAALYLSYFTICHWYAGRTVGKWLFGLRVARVAGGELSFVQSLGRSLAYVVSGQLTLGVGFLFPAFRKDGRTLHDLLAQTTVTLAREEAPSATEAAPTPTERSAA